MTMRNKMQTPNNPLSTPQHMRVATPFPPMCRGDCQLAAWDGMHVAKERRQCVGLRLAGTGTIHVVIVCTWY